MSVHHKTYCFRMEPTKAQEAVLVRMAHARRWAWNWGLARRKEHYAVTGNALGFFAQSTELTAIRKQEGMEWLADEVLDVLRQSLRDLDQAFRRFFAKHAKFPRFKSRKRETARFRCTENVYANSGIVRIPKLGLVRIRQSQEVNEKIRGATFKRDTSGNWHVSIMVEFEMPDISVSTPGHAGTVGIDLGLISFSTTTEGIVVAAPKFYRRAQRKLRRAQKTLSRRKPGSKRRAKAKLRVAKIHQRITNRRSNFLHNLTTDLVRQHDAICIEDLNLNGLTRTKLAKSFRDAAMGEFRRQLTYKCEWNRKHLVVIDRWFPSSKMCNACKALNAELTLSDRRWTCACGAVHDRDLNAARNIKDEGLRMLAGVNSESLNARGARVRPAKAGSGC